MERFAAAHEEGDIKTCMGLLTSPPADGEPAEGGYEGVTALRDFLKKSQLYIFSIVFSPAKRLALVQRGHWGFIADLSNLATTEVLASEGSRESEELLPTLLCLADVGPSLKLQMLALAPQHWKEMDLLERVQWRATKMIGRLEDLYYEDRLKELGLFRLKRRLWGDLRAPSSP
ncbi:hypothetical protein llap_12880 [Limosa lapponica baueri]|uniref:Uncharacterized protein n=1 Tax=Limosa lapponica baueri TaxID=1758121 RepID=A0A2I0TSR5_LIMLA|nr:hypothetical protein llap_12880 [Limosa lapponica baueri]